MTCRILFFIRFFFGILAGHQCHVFCLKTSKRVNNITFETMTYVKVLSLVKLKKVRVQSNSSYHKHLIESFEKVNSVKTGFHHLRSFSVPHVNLKTERKLLQQYCQQHFHSNNNCLVASFEKNYLSKNWLPSPLQFGRAACKP